MLIELVLYTFLTSFQVSFVAPLFTSFGVESILCFYKHYCRFLFLNNIELVPIELLVPLDVLQTCAICVVCVLMCCAY